MTKMDAAGDVLTLAEPAPQRRLSAAPAPIRVLLVAPLSFKGGGMGRMMAYLADQDMDGRYGFELIESRGRGASLLSVWPLLLAAWTIWRRARAGGQVLLHLNIAERGSVLRKGALLYVGRALGLRTILHLHAAEMTNFYENLGPFARARIRGVFHAADTTIVLGQGMADWLAARLGVPQARIAVVHNGVPSPRLLPSQWQGARPSLLFLGNLQARKGLGDLLTALARAPLAAHPFDLIVAGGGDAAPWRAQARALGLEARVTFTGWLDREEVTALLARAFVLVLPSYHEGLPLVLLEAASMGVPSITTPVGAIAEVFTDGQTALLVPPGDSAALSAAILRIMDEPGLRARLGREARALYERAFSMEIFSRRLAGVYAQAQK